MTVRQHKLALILTLMSFTILALSITLFSNVAGWPVELGPGLGNDEGGVTNILGGDESGPDWGDLFNANGEKVNAGDVAAFVKDDISAGSAVDSTVYSGGPGDKNQDPIADWTWSTSSVPAKDDVTNAYAFAKVINGDLIVFVGVEREDPSGDSHVDVEFFQNVIDLSEEPPCDGGKQCRFTGTNKNGDLLANLDFSQGGTFGGLSIRERHEGVRNNYDLIVDLKAEGCNPGFTVCAFSNQRTINGGPWPNYDNHGSVVTNLQANAFTEFGVNVTDLFGFTPCFSTIQVKTRSSQSFTATLKDFRLHSFAQCSATARTEIHEGTSVGATHNATDIQNTTVSVQTKVHDKMIVTGTAGFAAPTGNVTFSRYTSADCTGTAVTEVVALTTVDAANSISAAESSDYTPGPGSLSFKATYAGDTNYATAVTADCEPLTISRFNSAVNTDLKLNNIAGDSVLNTAVNIKDSSKDIVDLAEIVGNPGGPDPTGKVTFRRFTTGNCTGSYVDEELTIVADADPTDGKATKVSSAHTLSNLAGSLVSFAVLYQGDSNYNASWALKCEALCAFPFDAAVPTQ